MPLENALDRQILWPMVEPRKIRVALRQLRVEANMTPEEFADEAGVSRATVYRIEELNTSYAPRVDTVAALVVSRGMTLSSFFARIEGLQAPSNGGTTSVPLITIQRSLDSNGPNPPVSSSSAPKPLDDTNAVIAANSAALVHLARALDRIGERLDRLSAVREQTPSPSPAQPKPRVRDRKTG